MINGRRLLAGDLIARDLTQRVALAGPVGARQRSGGTDPESVAEFLAFDLDFREEPAVGVVFPPEAGRE